MAASYFTNFTRVGCLIQFLMDWCDIWLPFAKMLRYLRLPTLCDGAFVVFLVSWFVTRQLLYGYTIWSTYHDAPKYLPLVWEPERGHFLNRDWYNVFLTLLIALQVRISYHFHIWVLTFTFRFY
jgi:acyl-CoA-dependent ceramide synthase